MPIKGRDHYIEPFATADERDVTAAARKAANLAFRAMAILLMGDPYWLGAKRSLFRVQEFCACATSPASMEVRLSRGSGYCNDGVDYEGDWHLVYSDGSRGVTISAAHPTLARYDTVVLVPKKENSGSRQWETIQAEGNVAVVDGPIELVHEFDLVVREGLPGGAMPAYDRTTAWQYFPAGEIPIATVHVAAGVSSIADAAIKDLRELFLPRQYPIRAQDVPSAIAMKLGYVVPAIGYGCVTTLFAGGNVADVPQDQIFLDMTGGGAGVLRWKNTANVVFDLQNNRISSAVPATATSPGTAGDVAYDATYIYVCIATNTWKRSALSTW
jgi:hypothetical protein